MCGLTLSEYAKELREVGRANKRLKEMRNQLVREEEKRKKAMNKVIAKIRNPQTVLGDCLD
jgi:hypothetical protein